jgi:hypothetical protein
LQSDVEKTAIGVGTVSEVWSEVRQAFPSISKSRYRCRTVAMIDHVYGGAFMEAKRKANTLGGAAGAASRPHQIAKGRQVDGLS